MPSLGRKSQVSEMSFAAAKQQYDSFRRRQENVGSSLGKVNTLLTAMKRNDEKQDES